MNEPIKTIIVDDDPVSILKLSDDLKSFPGIKVLETATSIEKARKIVIDMQPDLLFLDIEMPGMTGIDLLQEIQPEIHPEMRIVFYTAHDKYFRNAMLIADFDYYLLKPYLPEELSAAVKRIQAKEGKATIEQLLHKIIREKRFVIQTVTGIKSLSHDDVVFFEFLKKTDCWHVILSDNQHIQLRQTIRSKEILAITPNFIQINKKNIINFVHLSEIENKTLKCKLKGHPFDEEVSPRYYKKLKGLLDVL